MRLTSYKGVWVQYTGSAQPVETIDRVAYSFMNEERLCLITNPQHLEYLLQTGRYRLAGVEVEDPPSAPPAGPPPQKPVGRGRPRKP